MAVTVTRQNNPMAANLVQDTDADKYAKNNTTGAGGHLYSAEITNPNVYTVYLKMFNGLSASAGNTSPDLVMPCSASATKSFVYPGGIHFNSGFCHWCVTGSATSDSNSPLVDVTVRYVTS